MDRPNRNYAAGFLTLLKKLPFRQDVGLVLLLAATLAMMVLPMPTIVADTLIAVNIGISVLLLMVAIYLRTPAEFSTLPSVILVTTIFRLSISITTSRLVLTQADAGEIIRTFGEFVISGNVVVGLVVFLIISIVQFVVITKGSERVAEVSARFALDAMPGKQMSIDTDVRNGDLKPEEAKRRRRLLAQESQMHGAMDGAMKFVKGDAIASLVIIAVNLIGGITIGCLQNGMSFSEAGATYSLLAVGDGLIAQIPALLISLTAGLIVTRVDNEDASNLGTDMIHQITGDSRTLMLAAGMLMGMGMIPGFPTAVFEVLAIILFTTGFVLGRRKREKQAQTESALQEAIDDARGASMLVQLGPSLAAHRVDIVAGLRHVRSEIADDLGIALPRLEVTEATDPGVGLRVEMDRVQMLSTALNDGELWVERVVGSMAMAGETRLGPGGQEWIVLPPQAADQLRDQNVVLHDALAMVSLFLRDTLLRNAGQFVGIQETQLLVGRVERNYSDLVREAMRAAPLPRLAEVFRRLIEERVSLRNLRQVLEAVAEWAPREKSTPALAEYVRVGVRQQICQRCAGPDMRLPVLLIEDDLAMQLTQELHETITGTQLRMEDPDRLVNEIRIQAGETPTQPIIVTTMELRRPLWELLSRYGLDFTVLSHPEITPGMQVDVVATVAADEHQPIQRGFGALRAIPGGMEDPELRSA